MIVLIDESSVNGSDLDSKTGSQLLQLWEVSFFSSVFFYFMYFVLIYMCLIDTVKFRGCCWSPYFLVAG